MINNHKRVKATGRKQKAPKKNEMVPVLMAAALWQ